MVLAEGTTFDNYGDAARAGLLGRAARDAEARTATPTPPLATACSGQPDSNGLGRDDQADWLKLKAGGDLIGYRQFGGGKANDAYVVLTNNANTGGTCFGDSGGPTFIEDTTTVVAVTSFGVNSTCAGTSGVYRLDTVDDLAWLSQFID